MTETKNECALYRFYDRDGRLLYVGITDNPRRRDEQHGATKAWWREVATKRIEWLPSREAALAAERLAIETENPLWNTQRPSVAKPARRKPQLQQLRELVWTCRFCNREVADGAGYLTLDMRMARRYGKAWAQYGDELAARRREQGGRPLLYESLADMPDLSPAHWYATHRACDPIPESSDYFIEVERIGTYSEMLHWTGHLMEKNWLESTDWHMLCMRVGDG